MKAGLPAHVAVQVAAAAGSAAVTGASSTRLGKTTKTAEEAYRAAKQQGLTNKIAAIFVQNRDTIEVLF